MPQNLAEVLALTQLAEHEPGLRNIGVDVAGDVLALEDADLEGIGMKATEISRLRRAITESTAEQQRQQQSAAEPPAAEASAETPAQVHSEPLAEEKPGNSRGTVRDSPECRNARDALAQAVLAASSARSPCCSAFSFPETWDGGETFHCTICKQKGAFDDNLEHVAMKATLSLDDVERPGDTEVAESLLNSGVSVRWLVEFAKLHSNLMTYEVVQQLVQPSTAETRCRYVELPDMQTHVGRANAFVSHTWATKFADTASAAEHAVGPDGYVWLDIFAVRQWPGNVKDLNFKPVVAGCTALVLSATDNIPVLDDPDYRNCLRRGKYYLAIGNIDRDGNVIVDEDGFNTKKKISKTKGKEWDVVGQDVKKQCPFFRVWCVVELCAAITYHKPVILLFGRMGPDGQFKQKRKAFTMFHNLKGFFDVRNATATVEKDRIAILQEVQDTLGFAAVNSLVTGVLEGSTTLYTSSDPCGMPRTKRNGDKILIEYDDISAKSHEEIEDAENVQDVILAIRRAACGFEDGLLQLFAKAEGRSLEEKNNEVKHANWSIFLSFAAEAGYISVLRRILELQPAALEEKEIQESLHDALGSAISSGNALCIRTLLDAGASANRTDDDGPFFLHEAIEGGHVEAVRVLLEHGNADPNLVDDDGDTPLMIAMRAEKDDTKLSATADIVRILAQHESIDVNATNKEGKTALSNALFGNLKNLDTDTLRAIAQTGKFDMNMKYNDEGQPCGDDEEGSTLLQHLISMYGGTFMGKWRVMDDQHEIDRTLEFARILVVDGKADVNVKYPDEEEDELSILHNFLKWRYDGSANDMALVRMLIVEGKADVNVKDGNGRTILEDFLSSSTYQGSANDLELARLLIEARNREVQDGANSTHDKSTGNNKDEAKDTLYESIAELRKVEANKESNDESGSLRNPRLENLRRRIRADFKTTADDSDDDDVTCGRLACCLPLSVRLNLSMCMLKTELMWSRIKSKLRMPFRSSRVLGI